MTETRADEPQSSDPELTEILTERVEREAGRRGLFTAETVRSALPLLIALAIGVFYPFLVDQDYLNAKSWPIIGEYLPGTGTAVIILVFTMMAIGLNIVVGYAGLLDLGYVAFYAAGAYVAGWLASQHFTQTRIHLGSTGINTEAPGIHLSIWMVVAIAGIFTAIVGIVIGLPTLRLRGDYLAIVTLGFGEIVPQFVRNADSIKGFDLTHGSFGIAPIDSPGFGQGLSDATGGLLPVTFRSSFDADNLFYWSALGLLLITVFCSWRLRDSRLGRAWIAIREDETAAAAMGVPLMRTKTWSYAIGAFFGGVAGAYYASFKSGAFPSDFYFNISVFLLCMVILGGMGSIWGVLVAGIILGWLNFEGLAIIGNNLNENVTQPIFDKSIDVPKYQFGIYGIIIVTMMLFRPAGLIPERRRKLEVQRGVHDEPATKEGHA
jgi:branched-chain amino acid transport system permease protein